MIVVGIDPAPRKGLMICKGHDRDKSFERKNVVEAHEYIDSVSNTENDNEDVLVCWDSPLTGPPIDYLNPVPPSDVNKKTPSPYVQRPIDKALASMTSEVKGISTLPYSQCSHWTISRALLGLPRVGLFDRTDNLPFQLITEDVVPTKRGKYIVEVHPAVALWLWLNADDRKESVDNHQHIQSWRYKSGNVGPRRKALKELWERFRRLECVSKVLDDDDVFPMTPCEIVDKDRELPHTDDHLDAMVAYTLGKLWLRGEGDVKLYGNKSCGSMLLPVEVERYLDEAKNKVLCPKHNES